MPGEESSIEAARERAEEASSEEGQTEKFEEGFTGKAIVGALFIAFIMLPGALYLGLVAGQGLGPAAQWVTIVLFAEVARRSFMPLKRQEIYILFYIAGGLAHMTMGDRGISGGPFGSLIWNQYFVQSPQAASIVHEIPRWVVPQPGSQALIGRTFFHPDWLVPILLLVIGEILGRMNWIGLGYVLFRITSDVERLPFPMAPVAASGATALAEASTKEESWRWQVFSIGTMVGLVFGFFYLAVPIFTGVVLSKPLMLIPIPFIDFARNTERALPAALTGISGDLGGVLTGFVLPFQIVVGMFISSITCQIITNPILQKHGLLPTWRYGMDSINTHLSVSIDFWMSISVGISVAVAVIGIYAVISSAIKASANARESRLAPYRIPTGRGDFPIVAAIAAWFFATLGYIIIAHKLVPLFPLWILIGFGFFYSPIMSYVSARMFGLTGHGVGFPYVREATVIKSGYRNADIWFAPIPIYDMGWAAARFREVELTRTKFTSVLKAEALMLPVMLTASFLFWAFFWHTNPIPSPQFPYAQKFWPLSATFQSIWLTANKAGESNFLLQALKPRLMVFGGVGAFIVFGILAVARVPQLYFYGLAGGVGAYPHNTIPLFIGALLGRYYFGKRFGVDRWRMYTPVLLAGYSCGMGLMGMSAIALALISKSVQALPY
ncbi:MAG: peptide transporter [Armatimonadota bacterium]|nr:peptide transporter [Armatimonadota bacterium]